MSSKFELAFKVEPDKVSVKKIEAINDSLNDEVFMGLKSWKFELERNSRLLVYSFESYVDDMTIEDHNAFFNHIRPIIMRHLGDANE